MSPRASVQDPGSPASVVASSVLPLTVDGMFSVMALAKLSFGSDQGPKNERRGNAQREVVPHHDIAPCKLIVKVAVSLPGMGQAEKRRGSAARNERVRTIRSAEVSGTQVVRNAHVGRREIRLGSWSTVTPR